MKHAALALSGFVLLVTGIWLVAQPFATLQLNLVSISNALVQYSGILSISLMSMAMVLANRPVVLEPFFGGLDEMYRLHKWLTITALVTTISHWLLIQVPDLLIELGWLARPAWQAMSAEGAAILQLFQSQPDLAKGMGEFAFYSTIALIANGDKQESSKAMRTSLGTSCVLEVAEKKADAAAPQRHRGMSSQQLPRQSALSLIAPLYFSPCVRYRTDTSQLRA